MKKNKEIAVIDLGYVGHDFTLEVEDDNLQPTPQT
jgi:hypothetical protein